ncbi:CDP-alcohol phosphatidyltransferase [Rhodococcus sp. P27]|nr:CDP-alcohol phosphatidyltransferase [Rhodococcus sp. P27]
MAGFIAATSSEPELTTGRVPAVLSFFGRASVSKVTAPMGKALVKTGLTPDSVTVIGTVASVAGAVTLFPSGHLFWGTLFIWFFVMFDMLDGAMARARGGGTRYGAVLDATCDRVADGAIFAGLAWWAVYHENSKWLLVATLICLVTSQVISYAKARAEASGLTADGGWIERPDRLIIVLVGSGLTGMGLPWAIHIAMWVLAAGSIVTVFQRVLAVRNSPGARELLPIAPAASTVEGAPNTEGDPKPEGEAEQ